MISSRQISGMEDRSDRSTHRLMYLSLAYGFVGLGALGAVLPVMPTTPFLLVALWAAARSSPRLRFRLYRHPRYGRALRAWHRHGAVPARAKFAACLLMAVSLLVLWLAGAAPFVLTMVALFFTAVATFILSRPPSPEPTRRSTPMQTESIAVSQPPPWMLWAYPFRPFFAATAIYAIAGIGAWLGVLLLGWPLAGDYLPMQWHSHEMLFGMVAAAVAGFLLTAMCNWTGAAPLSGWTLQALFGLWLAGRIAMCLSNWLPLALVAVIDLTFLAAVAVYAGRVIIGAGSYRNLPLVAVVSALWLANLLFHTAVLNGDPALVQRAELSAVLLIVMLIVIIGGRITPAFTRNWMTRTQIDPACVKTRPWVEAASISATALLALLLLAGAPAAVTAGMAAVAGLANAIRVVGWSGWRAHREPLVWILHAGYAWIPLGLLLMAVAYGLPGIPRTAWLHAMGPGAMAVMIVGVMTRVALGHTGRALELPRGAVSCYALILIAALVRLATALDWLPWRLGVTTTTAAWVGAFGVFLWLYLPILVAPRADGKPG